MITHHKESQSFRNEFPGCDFRLEFFFNWHQQREFNIHQIAFSNISKTNRTLYSVPRLDFRYEIGR